MSIWERSARERLPAHVRAYFEGPRPPAGHPDEPTQWSALRFRPRVLVDTTAVDLATTVLGTPVTAPVLVAPMAQQRAADPEGERATARAAARCGTLLAVSTNTGVPFAEIGRTGAPWWFQVYVLADRALTADVVQAAVAQGARALVLTADLPVIDPAYPESEPRIWPDRFDMFVNMARAELGTVAVDHLRGARDLTPDVIGWLADVSGLPVVVKGVLRGDDAVRCVEAGAAAVLVSTHGGRRLGQSVSSAAALPEVVEAVDGRAEVYVDSGIRTPEHVAAALCLGARAVFLGRSVLWALAAGGEAAVTAVLTETTAGLASVCQQLGARNLAELSPDLLA